jgi:flagellar biosynthetic protein FliO
VNGNGKRVTALCILLVVGGGWAGLASRYTGQAAQVRPQAGTGTATRSFLSDPNSSPLTASGLDNGEVVLRMILTVGAVLGLGVAALYLVKKVLPRVANPAGREIRILETTCLGPRKALHLVEVGTRRLLIASTSDSITMLAPMGEAHPETSEQPVDNEVEL